MRLLDRLENVDVVHQVGNRGREPFDFHTCGAMSLASLEACLDHVFGEGSLEMACVAGAHREKVHSDDPASWISNRDETRARFGTASEAWCGPEDVPGGTS